MSTASQNNGRKSSNSSVVNTPASTPITNINGNNSQVNAQNSPPPNNNAPKYGTLVPNRIFVGGISANTTEGELMQLFSSYGTVKAAKIIQDRAGVSKGYGFITFESEDDAKRPLRDSDNIVLKERKLNIAPAIKKQPFSRAFDASSPPAVAAGNPAQFFFPPGAAVPYFQGGVAYYPQPGPAAPGDPGAQQPVYQPPPVYPTQTGPPQTATYPSMMFPQTIYMPQQYHMPMPYDYNYYQGSGGMPPGPAYMVSASSQSGGPPGSQCPPSAAGGGMPHGPNSPPRPPCYGQQMPPAPYNPADPAGTAAVFYNVPVYGHPAAAMEGSPIYADGFDLGPPGGAYGEDNFPPAMVDNNAQQQQDVEIESQIMYDITPPVPPLPIQHLQTITTTAEAVEPKPCQSTAEGSNDNARNSETPVVSLLSIDHQQEKDYMSMQGGRRRKSHPLPPPTQMPHPFPPNGFISYPGHFHHQPPANTFSYNGHFNGQQVPMLPDMYRYNKITNGIKKRRPAYSERRLNDHSSRSSLRTDSNSSASCVDENKNEEKNFRTNVNTPPPAPYSPMTNHGQYKIITNSRSYRTSPRNSSYSKSSDRSTRGVINNNNHNNNNVGQSYQGDNKKHESVLQQGQEHQTSTYFNQTTSNSSQMHGGSQNFNPPVRRSRRSIRRSTNAAGNEIGAGDAPLPSDDVVSDVTKKLETLKL